MTFIEALRHAIESIIDSNLDIHETRTAVTALIPKEHHVTDHQ